MTYSVLIYQQKSSVFEVLSLNWQGLRDAGGSSIGTGETGKLYFGAPAELF